jgi:magnesium chelatase subunit D
VRPDYPSYPFSAIVGHERLRLALVLCAVRPQIGGVLIRGEKGTAKSTAVRGLAAVLSRVDGGRLVELPLGATEDRVIGSLDLQRVLRDGEHAFTPGLLAQAHGGVLYVDEVNLLHDHLVDVLLDAAALGRVHIERDGVSHTHEARFMLVGTMNPEEGELRPQLLDRFGLTVDVRASRDVDERARVVRQRMAFDADPDAFARQYDRADERLARRISAARRAVGSATLSDDALRRIAALCAAFEVDGMRADLVVANTAVAHAAWRGADAVSDEDIRVAAELALPHRRRRDPFDEPGLDRDLLDEALARAHVRSNRGRRAPLVRHRAGRRAPSATARPSPGRIRRHPTRGAGRPRRQPGDLPGRRVRFDGSPRPDGRRQRSHVVAAARRV